MSQTNPDRDRLLAAILPQVPFDGWSDAAFAAACAELGMTVEQGRLAAPRGAVDLAVAHHKAGDAAMVTALRQTALTDLRYSERVALALKLRLEAIPDKEVVRRATALFALPHLAGDGARLIWGTADAVWDALGDTSNDLNWYTKRATLSAVWATVVLYWLGDDSTNGQATTAFIDRRIGDVMAFEKAKAQVNANTYLRPLTGAFSHLASMIRPPMRMPPADLPGHWTTPN